MYNVVASRDVDDDDHTTTFLYVSSLVKRGKEQEEARAKVKSRSLSEFCYDNAFLSYICDEVKFVFHRK